MLVLAVGLAVCAAACDNYTPLKVIANRSPAVQSLVAFPTTIRPGDSAVVVCGATDPDGDTLVYDWSSDCRMVRKGAGQYDDGTSYDRRDRSLVVYAGACNRAPEDTGWVRCEVRDHRGGGAYAGVVRIVVRQ
jgi:hypothetical protein